MSLRNRLVLPIILSTLAVLAGCGSSTHNAVPPPTGAFSNTNFSGTYTFSVLGFDGTGQFAMAGSLTACGCAAGTIAGGTVDLVDTAGVAPASAIGSNSTYSISPDGRGLAQLIITPTGGSALEIDVDFVLTSSTHGMISRYDGSGTGSGTIDQQDTVAQAGLANVPFAFTVSGSDLANDPLAQVGAFTLDSSGTITTGIGDTTLYSFNTFTATPFPNSALTGSLLVGAGTAPGPVTLTTASFGSLTFDVYTVNSTHLKLIETDGLEVLVGDVFSQPDATIPTGNLVFSAAGVDPSGFPFTAAGLMSSDGESLISGGSEDLNDDGQVDFGTNPAVPQQFAGTFVATGGGRFQVSLSTFSGGATFAAYPSSGGLLLQEIDFGAGSGVTGGVALAQTSGAALAASQGYGMNMTGADLAGGGFALDEIAEFKTTSTGMTGLLDANDGGGLNTSNLSGNYTAGSSGTGAASFNTGLAGMFYYAVDGSTALFISTDSGEVGLGALEIQTTPAQAALAQPRAISMTRSIPRLPATARHTKARFVRK